MLVTEICVSTDLYKMGSHKAYNPLLTDHSNLLRAGISFNVLMYLT